MAPVRDPNRLKQYLPKPKSPLRAVLGYSGLLFLVGYVLYLGHQASDLFSLLTDNKGTGVVQEASEPEPPSTTFRLDLPPEIRERDNATPASDGDAETVEEEMKQP